MKMYIFSTQVHRFLNSPWDPRHEPWSGEGRSSPQEGVQLGEAWVDPAAGLCSGVQVGAPPEAPQPAGSNPQFPEVSCREPAPHLGVEGGDLLLEVPLGLLLLLQLLL